MDETAMIDRFMERLRQMTPEQEDDAKKLLVRLLEEQAAHQADGATKH